MLLDFYGIGWEYEPTEFVLERDRAGRPVQGFRPDFYLPAYDLFIEITTMNQKLVTKKNAKVRRLRERHPDVRVKVLYQRDYLHLLVKYGLEEPSQLSHVALDADEPRPLDLTVVDDGERGGGGGGGVPPGSAPPAPPAAGPPR